jgi:hypothetical protein
MRVLLEKLQKRNPKRPEIYMEMYQQSGSFFGKAVKQLGTFEGNDWSWRDLNIFHSERRKTLEICQYVSHALFLLRHIEDIDQFMFFYPDGYVPIFDRVKGSFWKPSNITGNHAEETKNILRQVGRLIGIGIVHHVPFQIPFHPQCLEAITEGNFSYCANMEYIVQGIYQVLPFGLLSWMSPTELNTLFMSMTQVIDNPSLNRGSHQARILELWIRFLNS